MTAQFKNNVTATLAASISSTTTIIIVSSGQGAYFPLPSGGSYFYATLYDASNNIEIVKCTARTGDALTVLRGVDNSVANSYNAGDKVVMRVVAAALSNFAQQDGNNTFTGSNIFSGGLAGNLTGNTAGTHTGPVIGNADTATNATNATTATTAAGPTSSGTFLGNNQSFSNQSRSLGTTYTNSTGKPIWVAVCWDAPRQAPVYFYVNGTLAFYSNQDTYPRPTVNAIVPNGQTYQVTGGSNSYYIWAELS